MKQYWVVGGEFTSLNFHSFAPGTSDVLGPYDNREGAEEAWKKLSSYHKFKAAYRAIILEDSVK